MEPNLAGMVLGKRRFRCVQMRLMLHGERLLGALKGGNKVNIQKLSPQKPEIEML